MVCLFFCQITYQARITTTDYPEAHMNIDKAKKRIAKRIKMGFQGYPAITISYKFDENKVATTVLLSLVAEENSPAQEQAFQSKGSAYDDDSIQSAIVKMIERCEVKTVLEP
jgi:hypothetical protein